MHRILALFLCSVLVVLAAGCAAAPTTAPDPSPAPTRIRTRAPSATNVPTGTPSRPAPTRAAPTVPQLVPTATTAPPRATAKQRLNVRGGPGTGFAIVAQLDAGESAKVTGTNADGTWYQIAYPEPDGRGWIAAEFSTLSGALDRVAVVVLPTAEASATHPPATTVHATDAPPTPATAALNRIAFQSMRNGAPFDIFTINPDGTDERQLTNSPGNDQFPTWSPDGRRIAFSSDRDGQNEIYVMHADGTDQLQLAPHTEEDLVPRWSHNGTRIAFFSTRDGKSIFSMQPDGSDLKKLATDENISFDFGRFRLAWSPDDSKIAFTACDLSKDTCYLTVMGADGSNPERFQDAARPEYRWFESFSPDGRFQTIRVVGFGPQVLQVADAGTLANRHKVADGAEGVWSPK